MLDVQRSLFIPGFRRDLPDIGTGGVPTPYFPALTGIGIYSARIGTQMAP